MLRDFTLRAYAGLVEALADRYRLMPVASFTAAVAAGTKDVACLRHDVDRRIGNAVRCAEICSARGIPATFYFRHPHTFNGAVLRRVASLGHEVGYHYETMDKARGEVASAVRLFERELAEFRAWTEIRTVCMHGSPLSRWDNREIWSATSLADHGLVAEPYLSIDFSKVTYLTDTGRGWNRVRSSVRDQTSGRMPPFSSTPAVVAAVRDDALVSPLMVNVHPERWDDALGPWAAQLMGQEIRNAAKRVLLRFRSAGVPA